MAAIVKKAGATTTMAGRAALATAAKSTRASESDSSSPAVSRKPSVKPASLPPIEGAKKKAGPAETVVRAQPLPGIKKASK